MSVKTLDVIQEVRWRNLRFLQPTPSDWFAEALGNPFQRVRENECKFRIEVTNYDTDDPSRTISTSRIVVAPAEFDTVEACLSYLRDEVIHNYVLHEADEDFTYRNVRVFDPHTAQKKGTTRAFQGANRGLASVADLGARTAPEAVHDWWQEHHRELAKLNPDAWDVEPYARDHAIAA